MQLLIVLVIISIYNSRAISNSIKLVQRANPVLTNRTFFKRYVYSLRLLFKAVKTTKAPAAHALCLGLILTNRQVLGQVSLVFAVCSSSL